jgi:tripartite-type tricarboxylate transporter receptor subunit TctC
MSALHRRTLLTAFAAAALAARGGESAAQAAWPTRPVRVVLPFAAGGPTDTLARLLAEQLSARLGGRVIVENRAGAGSTIGADAVAKAPKDGHTLLFNNISHSTNAALYRRLPFDPVRDFAPVATLMEGPVLLLVKRDFPAQNLAEFIALLRREPDRHDYGSAGNGSASHISVAQLLSLTRTKMSHVVYRGTAPAVTDLLGGTVALVGDTSTTALGHLQGGAVRALAVTSPERVPFLPDVPTVRESGIPELADYRMSTWNMLFAPAGTPEPILRRLHDETRAALADPAFARLAELGNVPMPPTTPEGARDFLAAEQERWRRVLADAGVQPE